MKYKRNSKNKITVVGLGYVGLPLALLAGRKGYQVVGVDRDDNKVKKINNKIAPYKDMNITNFLKDSNIHATTKWEEMTGSSIIIVCVPTPVNHQHKPDLDPVKDSCIQIGKHLQKGQLVILESTVNPGVCEEVVCPILEEMSGMKVNKDFYLAHCPERINPGDKNWNVENIPRVIGSLDTQGLKKGLEFYRSIVEAEIKPMGSIKEAEAVKIVENSFRDVNIAFVNELAQSFYHLGIDVMNVIGGASTKPFSFMAHYPGCGVGGHCIPVDPYYLIEYAKKNGYKHRFLALARNINNGMPAFTVGLAETLLDEKNQSLLGAKVAVLGLAYKANIDDCRESPSFKIIEQLEKKGAKVSTYDPYIKDKSNAISLQEAIQDAKLLIIATAHSEFKKLTPLFFIRHNVSIIVDGQNCLPREKFIQAGIIYEGIGRHHIYHQNEYSYQ
jgi:UDP-N-acetyl-D-glucosamine dehydrogenase